MNVYKSSKLYTRTDRHPSPIYPTRIYILLTPHQKQTFLLRGKMVQSTLANLMKHPAPQLPNLSLRRLTRISSRSWCRRTDI